MEDMIGSRFGRLVVKRRAADIISPNTGKHYVAWECNCDCGGTKIAKEVQLLYGKTRSCGCLYNETRRETKNRKHGLSRTRVYSEWNKMIQRCTNPNIDSYKNYGGRGISVCAEWLNDFCAFYKWAVDNGYSDDLTLDRIDNDVGYMPCNCRWVSQKRQANNRRNNQNITIGQETKTLSEWCEQFEMPYQRVWHRIFRHNIDPLEALTNHADLRKGRGCAEQ